uniref:Potassium channel domain-containing protein n=1 Tax=Anopheles minimus TaxID=112268 RepID=A0A182WAU0_9DIPT
MPLFLLYLSNIGDILAKSFKWIYAKFCLCRILKLYIFFGARLFADWENWDILDGSYFCFISLSSIGFGDIVPGASLQTKGDTKMEISFILCAVYLLLGMALIAMCFNLMQVSQSVLSLKLCNNHPRSVFSQCAWQEQVIYKIRSLKKCVRGCFRCAKAVPVPVDEPES